MDLQTFVDETLRQILAGIRSAQKSDGGGNINAEHAALPATGNIASNAYGAFTLVSFDIAVSAETAGGGKASLQVFGIGADAAADHKQGYANRVSFGVPVRLPDGDRNTKDSSSFNRDLSSGQHSP